MGREVRTVPLDSEWPPNKILLCEECGAKQQQRVVRRLCDGKVLPMVDRAGDEICVEELFDFADGGQTPRPLRLWHAASEYEPFTPQRQSREGELAKALEKIRDMNLTGDIATTAAWSMRQIATTALNAKPTSEKGTGG